MTTQRIVALIAAMSLIGCRPAVLGSDVRFELGARTVTVDSSVGYSIVTEQPVIAHGRDSADTYLIVVDYRQAVSLSAGKKAPEGTGSVVVHGGSGTISWSAYASKCGRYSESDCMQSYVDPEQTFEILGYVPVTGVRNR